MKKIVLFLGATFLGLLTFSQNPASGNRGNGAQQMMGRFYGKVVEASTGKGVDAASVQLVQSKPDTVTKKRVDVVINGMLTKANGEFTLENVPMLGQYKLKITAIGFTPYEKNIAFDLKMGGDMSAMLNAVDKDLGNVKLEIDAQILGAVTVTASNPLLRLGVDRKIFNVDKNIVSAGGTAVDVMRSVPSLSVDIDGNVALRNNAPQIFVDGRPTTMQLDQIPADAIESVEIITNPSAKFDASGGTAGILNIVLKKNKKVGYNGSIRTNIDSRARVGIGGDINMRQNKLNLFASGNYMQRKSISNGTTDRLTLIGNPQTDLRQVDKSTMKGSFMFGRAGFDYFISNRNTFSASINMGRGSFKPNTISDIFIDSLYSSGVTSSFNQRISNSAGEFRNMGTTLSFKHNFPKAGREITADATYNLRKNENNNVVETDYYKLPQNTLEQTFRQRQLGSGKNKSLVVQTDYTDPITDKSKIEMGVRAAFNDVNSMNNFYTYNSSSDQYEYISALSNIFASNDRVLAAYATYSNQAKSFGYLLGLRAESSKYEGRLPDKNLDFNIEFPLSFFPSVFLTQKLKNDQEMQLNYSRRINRPGFWQLFPFTDYSDSLNLSRGNPDLNPEFTNSIELSYQKIFKNKDNFLTSLYYKNTNDLITRFQVLEQNAVSGKDQLINTYINANSSYVTGLEMILKNKITKWWEITSNMNFFTSKIKLNDPTIAEQDQFASWFGKLSNSLKLPKNFTIQLSGEYQSKTILPPGGSGGRGGGFGGPGGMFGQTTSSQGYVRPNYFVDAAVRFEFLKNKAASISLNVNDIFKTRRSSVHSESPYFIQDVVRYRDPQILRLNFNWRFGKFDPNLFKRKNTKGERESMNNMDTQF
jgi:outer membrane receptor protein involved in Fe transport